MNHAVVVDSSVAVKWVLFEEFTYHARAFYDANIRARRPILAPPHFQSEVTNAIYQRARARDIARRITEDEAHEALRGFSGFRIETMSPSDLYERAFEFARANRLTSVYDSLYVVLAQMLQAELWTDDRPLINSVGGVAPWIRWIGDYPLT
jgi:predicted nucleic acid-binding protein